MSASSKEDFFKLCFYHDALPPCFNINWSENTTNNLFEDVDGIPKHSISHSIEGSGLHQREITVVHPFALWCISSLLYDNWTSIMAHFNTSYPDSTFEALTSPKRYFKPTVPEEKDNLSTITSYIFTKKLELRRKQRSTAQYVLFLDINNFFHSVYSHALDWCFTSIEDSKRRVAMGSSSTPEGKKRRLDEYGTEQLFSELLDKYIRMGQDDETMGIPIGPLTSFIVAEILLARLDFLVRIEFEKLSKQLGRTIMFRGFRVIDDYELVFDNMDDLEKGLQAIEKLFHRYHLSFNSKKSDIMVLPRPLLSPWKTTLLDIPNVGQMNTAITYYHDTCLQLQNQNPQEQVMRFGFKQLIDHGSKKIPADKEKKEFFECVIYTFGPIIVSDPILLSVITSNVAVRAITGKCKNLLTKMLNKIVMRCVTKNKPNELVWALHAAEFYDCSIEFGNSTDLFNKMQDPLVAALLISKTDFHRSAFPTDTTKNQHWETILQRSENWIVRYHMYLKQTDPSPAYLKKGEADIFKKWKDASVEFVSFDTQRKHPSLSSVQFLMSYKMF